MDEWIARLNIEYLRTQLDTELDETKRKTLLQLLAEEETKLATALRNALERRKTERRS